MNTVVLGHMARIVILIIVSNPNIITVRNKITYDIHNEYLIYSLRKILLIKYHHFKSDRNCRKTSYEKHSRFNNQGSLKTDETT